MKPKLQDSPDPIPPLRRLMQSISDSAVNDPKKYLLGLFSILIPLTLLMIGVTKLDPVNSEAAFLGMPLVSCDDHAFGWIALGKQTSVGLFAFGGMAFGVIAIGGISFGLFSAGGLAVGLLAALGGGALGFYGLGGLSIGGHAFAGQGVAIGKYSAEGTQKQAIIGSDQN